MFSDFFSNPLPSTNTLIAIFYIKYITVPMCHTLYRSHRVALHASRGIYLVVEMYKYNIIFRARPSLEKMYKKKKNNKIIYRFAVGGFRVQNN